MVPIKLNGFKNRGAEEYCFVVYVESPIGNVWFYLVENSISFFSRSLMMCN